MVAKFYLIKIISLKITLLQHKYRTFSFVRSRLNALMTLPLNAVNIINDISLNDDDVRIFV